MDKTLKSNSAEQQIAGQIIFDILQKRLNIPLRSTPKLFLSDNSFTYMEPDFYSAEHRIIGEIFVHIGKPKKAQDNKIANDILKMLLLEKVTGHPYRKMLVVCDEEEEQKLLGRSVLAESIRQFGIEVLRIEIDEKIKSMILDAQKRQMMVNA